MKYIYTYKSKRIFNEATWQYIDEHLMLYMVGANTQGLLDIKGEYEGYQSPDPPDSLSLSLSLSQYIHVYIPIRDHALAVLNHKILRLNLSQS